MRDNQPILYPTWSWIVGIISLAIFFLSASWLLWAGNSAIRYTADHTGTISIWVIWIPSFVGILLTRLIPLHLNKYNPLNKLDEGVIRLQTWIFVLGAVLFPATLLLVKGTGEEFQLWYMILKLGFLLVIPWMFLFIFKLRDTSYVKPKSPSTSYRWYWIAPLIITSIWIYLRYFSILSPPHVPSKITDSTILIITLLVGFLINSLLEEIFYRVWLQTRLERLIGPWSAILLTSILWAIWHVAIQSIGQWDLDLATVISHQGVTGLFLGYLWAKYRNVWVLIIIHGVMNASPQTLMEILNM
jgi:membrane protease YdiL (CAAX protease family)